MMNRNQSIWAASIALSLLNSVVGFNFRLHSSAVASGVHRRIQGGPLIADSLPAPPVQQPDGGFGQISNQRPSRPSDPQNSGDAMSSPDALNAESTTDDVLSFLSSTRTVAPYVGAHGVALVTGGSSGIGRDTVEAIAKTGMRVVLCARDAHSARQVVQDIYMANPSLSRNSIRVQSLDLSDLNSVQNAVEEVVAIEGHVDVICNNAGVSSVPTKQKTAQGFEMQIGVNHVGHFYLTRLLLPFINKGGRVVTVSSTAHASVKKMKVDDLNYDTRRYSPWMAYSQSKLANVMFASELQEKLNDEGRRDILSVSLHPGIVKTNLWRHNDHNLVDSVVDTRICKSSEQGAATTVFSCLTEDAGSFMGGDFLMDCQVEPVPRALQLDADRTTRKQLWQRTEEMIENAGFEFEIPTEFA